MTAYQEHVTNNTFLLMSPCADKFNCPNKEVSKNHCATGCKNLKLYRKLLDTYGQFSLGGLAYGQVTQSAVCTDTDSYAVGVLHFNTEDDYNCFVDIS